MKNQLNPLLLISENALLGLELLGQLDYHEKRMRNNRIGSKIMINKIMSNYSPIQLKNLLEKHKNPKARFIAKKLKDNMSIEEYKKVLNKYIVSLDEISIVSPIGLTRSILRKRRMIKQNADKFLNKKF